MNKLFTRISMAFVGIAMAVGVGVAAGSHAEAREVGATDTTETLTVSITFSGSGYKSSSTSNNTSAKHSIGMTYADAMSGGGGIQLKKTTGNLYSTTTTGTYISNVSFTVAQNACNLYMSTNGSSWGSATSCAVGNINNNYSDANGYKYWKIAASSAYTQIIDLVITYTTSEGGGGGGDPVDPAAYEITFGASITGFTSVTAQDITGVETKYETKSFSNLEWTLKTVSGATKNVRVVPASDSTDHIQIGTSNNPATQFSIRSNIFGSAKSKITGVTINTSGAAAASAATLSVSADEGTFTIGNNSSYSISGTTVTNCEFTSTGAYGHISINYTSITKGINIHSISIYASEDTTDKGKAYAFASKVEPMNSCNNTGKTALIAEYNGLSSSIKTLADAITLYDVPEKSDDDFGATYKNKAVTLSTKMAYITAKWGGGSGSLIVSSQTSNISSATLVIIVISAISLIAVSSYFVIRRRKENN